MKYEVLDTEPGGDIIQRVVNIIIDENSAVNFPADMQNDSYLRFLSEQNLTDKEVQALKPGEWHDMQQPVVEQPEVIEPVEEITEDGTE